jgi:hypothetical protein
MIVVYCAIGLIASFVFAGHVILKINKCETCRTSVFENYKNFIFNDHYLCGDCDNYLDMAIGLFLLILFFWPTALAIYISKNISFRNIFLIPTILKFKKEKKRKEKYELLKKVKEQGTYRG